MTASKTIAPKTIAGLFSRFRLEKVRFGPRFASAEFSVNNEDRAAAWELYVEMLTRVLTQSLPTGDGDEQAALESVYSLFATTRDILRRHGPAAAQFAKIAVPMLNQVVRPFTAKWHKTGLDAELLAANKTEFRAELASLQHDLRNYNRMLAEIAGVEDLTDLEQGAASEAGA